MQDTKWYHLSDQDTFKALSSSHEGLTRQEAIDRLTKYGRNELGEEKGVSIWPLVAEQFKSTLIIILLAAVAISVGLGIFTYEPGYGLPEEITDAIVIFVIVIACVALGVVEEYRSGKAMEALKKMAALTAVVVRDATDIEIPASEIVPGDIVLLATGDRVPADLRLIEAVNLKTNEASLTGESNPVEKITDSIPGDEVAIGDRKNMAYSGTTIAYRPR